MSLRVFRLDGSGSQVVTILQEGTGRPLIVSLNGRVFGTVAAPSAGAASDFTLDDGSTLRVRLVERRVQVSRSVLLPGVIASGGMPVDLFCLSQRECLLCPLCLGGGHAAHSAHSAHSASYPPLASFLRGAA